MQSFGRYFKGRAPRRDVGTPHAAFRGSFSTQIMRSRQGSSIRQIETYMKTVRSAEKRYLDTVLGVPLKHFKRKACDLDLNGKQLTAVSGLKKRREHLCIEQ